MNTKSTPTNINTVYDIDELNIDIIVENKKGDIFCYAKDKETGLKQDLLVINDVGVLRLTIDVNGKERDVSYDVYKELKEEYNNIKVKWISIGGISVNAEHIQTHLKNRAREVMPLLNAHDNTLSRYRAIKDSFDEYYFADENGKEINAGFGIKDIEPIVYNNRYVIVRNEKGKEGVFDLQDSYFIVEPEYDKIVPNIVDNKVVSFTATTPYNKTTVKAYNDIIEKIKDDIEKETKEVDKVISQLNDRSFWNR